LGFLRQQLPPEELAELLQQLKAAAKKVAGSGGEDGGAAQDTATPPVDGIKVREANRMCCHCHGNGQGCL
jgi:hypothetical protein